MVAAVSMLDLIDNAIDDWETFAIEVLDVELTPWQLQVLRGSFARLYLDDRVVVGTVA